MLVSNVMANDPTDSLFGRMRERRNSASDGFVRGVAACFSIFFALIAVVDFFWIGGSVTEDCETIFVQPFIVEGFIAAMIAGACFITACFPACALAVLILVLSFFLLMLGSGFWKLIACFGYSGWTCHNRVYTQLEHGSTAWMLSFVFGLIQTIVVFAGASCFCHL